MKKLATLFLCTWILLIGQACSDDDYPVPPASTVPQFTYVIDNNEFAPATVNFTNTSIVPSNAGDATFTWNFGDGNYSKEMNPSHLYEEPGVYVANLVIVTAGSLEITEKSQTLVIKDPNATGKPVFFTDGGQVYSALLNTQAPVFTPFSGVNAQNSYGLIMDTVAMKLYLSDYGGNKIYRMDPDGKNFEEFRTGVDSPNGMTIDYEEHMIYWDTSNGIQRGDLTIDDVSQHEDFVTGQSNDPDGISIDPVNRKLYWVNYDGGVWVKGLDGSGESELIPGPEGGSMLVVGDRIYYDEYVDSGDVRLKSASLDGTDITTLATGISRVVYGIAYDPDEDKIYWVDRDLGTIMRANLDGSSPEPWYVNEDVSPRGIVIGVNQ